MKKKKARVKKLVDSATFHLSLYERDGNMWELQEAINDIDVLQNEFDSSECTSVFEETPKEYKTEDANPLYMR